MRDDIIQVVTERGNTFRVTEENQSECRSCGAPIIWCVTSKGKKMPVDMPEGDEPTTSHFATCQDADKWRSS